MKLAPIVLFTYKRLDTLKKTINALASNSLALESDFIIYSDGPKNSLEEEVICEVRKYLKTISGFKTITIYESPLNKGLANSIINGVTEIINIHKKAIVLEDDLITSENFLYFMNSALEFYENNENVFSISGYGLKITIPKNYEYDVYFTPRGMSWGWATWKERWESVDWEIKDYQEFKSNRNDQKNFAVGGSDLCSMLEKQIARKIDSWAIRWYFNQYKKNQLTVYPIQSKVLNLGFDYLATHTNAYNRYKTVFDTSRNENFIFARKVITNPVIFKSFKSYFGFSSRIFYGRIISPIYRLKNSLLGFQFSKD
ncbi:sugar transferase [Flavobacterium myungsuense]|uniref:Sugar transferase n=1 Tax=Flavobacterium myungsuense TaxID=651823 RepID=A0ABW3J0M9_9FLAO